jgi:Threonine dehydrogenase and related Zn-dependent dehydrogenases
MGLVNTNTTPMLLRLIAEGRLDVDKFVSHHFKLDEMLAAYDTFGRAAETKALKVIIDVDRLAVRIRDDLQPRRDVDHFQVTMKIGCKWRG